MGGMLIVFKIQQSIIQVQMKEKMESDNSSYEYLRLSLRQYYKNKINSTEISIEGKMYDIKSRYFMGDSVKLLVINDIYEEIILQKIKDFIKAMSLPNQKHSNQFKFLISLKYLFPDSKIHIILPKLQFQILPKISLDFVSNDPEIKTPPPEIV
jgi:hypothetical protein